MSKNRVKTAEELMQEALVPVEEQLYPIPDNWVWVRLGKVAQINPPKSKLSDISEDEICSFIPMTCLSDKLGTITEIEQRTYAEVKKGYTQFLEGDVLFAKITPCMENGKSAIAKNLKNGFGYGSTEFFVIRTSKLIDNRYIHMMVRSVGFRAEAKGQMTGAVGQQRVPKTFLENYCIPLPPLEEQKRIANKVERLLNKINQAKQLIQEAKETFELRRAAILDKAFRGELTAKWREENLEIETVEVFEQRLKKKLKKSGGKVVELFPPHQLPSGWKWVHLKDIADSKSGYAFKSEHFSDVGIQVVRMGNLHKNVLNLDKNPVFLPKDYDNDLLEKFKINEGDILLSLTGTKYKRDYGYAVRVETVNDKLLLNQRILALTPLDLSDYFYYYLQSPVFRELFFSFETGAVNQGNVSSVSVGSIVFPLPPREEGIEIQRILGNLISKENELEQLLDSQESLELITQTILTKAFRGELGTNEPNDESVLSQLKDGLLQ